jgi:hypothetical protein
MDRYDRRRKISKKVQARLRVMLLIIFVPAGLFFTVLGVWKVLVKGDLGFLVFLLAGPFCLLFIAIALKTFGEWRWGEADASKGKRSDGPDEI